MKKYNHINNLEKFFKKEWVIGIDKDNSILNKFFNLIFYIFATNKLRPYLFVRLSVRGKIMYSLFCLIAFVLIPLGFIVILFVMIFIGFKVFN